MIKLNRLWFKLSDFNISGDPFPEVVADKILRWHIWPMSHVRETLGFKIWPSKKSGWRPVWWEHRNDRSGSSQHCFLKDSRGATDWTCDDFENNKDALLAEMIKKTDYKRFCIYPTFIHADYKDTHKGKRLLFEYKLQDDEWSWDFIKFVDNE